MWKLANSLWGDQDKPLGRHKGHPFLSCLVELAGRGVSKVSGPGGALGPVAPWHGGGGGCIFCLPAGIENSRSRGAPVAPQGEWGDPGACTPLGGTVLGAVLGFALAPGRAPHSQELRPGGRSALEEGDANWEARLSAHPVRRVAARMGGSRVLRQQRPAFATSHLPRCSLEGFGPGC